MSHNLGNSIIANCLNKQEVKRIKSKQQSCSFLAIDPAVLIVSHETNLFGGFPNAKSEFSRLLAADTKQHHQQHKPTLRKAHAVASHPPQASFCELTGVHRILATAYSAND